MKQKIKNYRVPKHKKKTTKDFLKVYWPYLPLIVLVFSGLIFGVGFRPQRLTHNRSVLAYATEISNSALLSSTNTKRSANGKQSLTINSKLSNAAQAKANDMVARNYWSHNTPDGQEPWVFVDAAGYSYQKAGENLAYGFATSFDTVNGWMNSASHKANMLDGDFTEVGFGYANANNYVNTGQETIVVAMYAKPQVAAATTTTSSEPVKSSTGTVKKSQTLITEDENKTAVPAAAPVEEPKKLSADRINQPYNSDTSEDGLEAESTRITKAQVLTGGKLPWAPIAISLTSGLVVLLWSMKHFIAVRRFFGSSEKFAMHHPIIDVLVVGFIFIAVLLSRSSGIVK
jgi:Cysteine-rich secretory protein family